MTIRVLIVFIWWIAAVGIVICGCVQSEEPARQPNPGLTALVVDKNAPLLLNETPETGKALTEAETKNAACYVCHANYENEPLAQWHAKANFACTNCHGESIAHKNDENHQTSPDIMYPANNIDQACRKCHPAHDVQPVEVVRRWREHIGDKTTDVLCEQCHESHDVPAADVVRKWQKQTGQKIYEKPIVCTDCHGQHRLTTRSVQYR